MSATSFGLLGTLIALLLGLISHQPSVEAVPITSTFNSTITVTATSKSDSNSTIAANGTTIFELPTLIEEDEILKEYARFMVGSMNQSVSPCENFYEYACGNWTKTELVPASAHNDSFLHTIQLKVNAMITRFLGNMSEADIKSGTAESKAKLFYDSCLKTNKKQEMGYKAVLEMAEFTNDTLLKGGDNITVDWITVNFLSPYAMHPLLPTNVHYNTETRKFELLISTPNQVLGTPELVDIKNLTRDFKIEGEENQKRFKEELELMIAFEKDLVSYVSKRNQTEELNLGAFVIKHREDKLNWTRFFDVASNGTAKNDWKIHNSIQDAGPLNRFLLKAELETLRTYVKWRTLIKFYYIWKAEHPDKTMESICRSHTEQYFNYALLPWFITQAYSIERRADILQMAKSIKEVFYDLIDKYTWLDEDTKSGAKTKLQSMDILAGYTDDMMHREIHDEIYKDINMTANWFTNVQVLEARRARVRMKWVGKSIIPSLMSTRDVNAFYADFLNMAFVAIGLSQMPFYHIKFPPSMKYGGIGVIIGHEMAHGFDSYCYQYNYDGKKQNWWSAGSLRNFQERFRCMESQYNKFIYNGAATNGNLTSGDNIADNVGTRIAYYAYLKSMGAQDGERKPLPGLSFTNKQLFFLKFAQTWCTGKDEASKLRKIKTDPHAYEEFRVMGTLSNMPEFSEVFQCKLGTDMNPLKKCVVW